MKLIGKSSGTGIKKGDIVKYNGEIYLATDNADMDGDIRAIDADQDITYIHESRLTKIYGADGKPVTPTVTIEMTVDELKVLVAATGGISPVTLIESMEEDGVSPDLRHFGISNHSNLSDILEEVAK